jgi:hypothetical protein
MYTIFSFKVHTGCLRLVYIRSFFWKLQTNIYFRIKRTMTAQLVFKLGFIGQIWVFLKPALAGKNNEYCLYKSVLGGSAYNIFHISYFSWTLWETSLWFSHTNIISIAPVLCLFIETLCSGVIKNATNSLCFVISR